MRSGHPPIVIPGLDPIRANLSRFRPLTPIPTIVMARLDRATALTVVLMQGAVHTCPREGGGRAMTRKGPCRAVTAVKLARMGFDPGTSRRTTCNIRFPTLCDLGVTRSAKLVGPFSAWPV
jgi:hypothetical protein